MLDVTLGYRALHYKPDTRGPSRPTQELFAGISWNLKHVVDQTLMPAAGSRAQAGARLRTLRSATEIVAVPFTALVLGGVSRSSARASEER